jgi:hypothetical protein
MKVGLKKYAFIISNDNRCIKFKNNKINTLQPYDIAQNYRILKVVERLSRHNLKFRTTAIFKRSVRENKDSNKTCRYAHDLTV